MTRVRRRQLTSLFTLLAAGTATGKPQIFSPPRHPAHGRSCRPPGPRKRSLQVPPRFIFSVGLPPTGGKTMSTGTRKLGNSQREFSNGLSVGAVEDAASLDLLLDHSKQILKHLGKGKQALGDRNFHLVMTSWRKVLQSGID